MLEDYMNNFENIVTEVFIYGFYYSISNISVLCL